MPIRVSGQGTGRPYIRYSPQANAWMQAGLDGPVEIEDMTSGQLCLDITRLQLGWLQLAEGVRDWEPWPSIDKRTPKPEGDYKVGVVLPVYSKKLLGDEVHDFSSNSTASTRFVENLYNEVENDLDPKKAVVIRITGSKPLKIGKGTTREIMYEVIKWIDRPAVFDAKPGDDTEERRPSAPQQKKQPPSPGRSVASKPAPKPAAGDDEADEF